MSETLNADVCVVGAGFAGLAAASTITSEGHHVVVLEARGRVGGRIWTERLSDGTPVDRGGAWLGPHHDAAFQLAGDLDAQTYKTWVKGAHLLVGDEKMLRYHGLIPKISPLAVVGIALAQLRVDWMARKVPLESPWAASNAPAWDSESVAAWLARTKIRTNIGKNLFEMAVRGLFATDLSQTSFLHLLYLVHAHRSISSLFSIKGGAQENMVSGGLGSVAEGLADRLGNTLRLNAPVRAITQRRDSVTVDSDQVSVQARCAIVAVPPALALEISFDPALPEDRKALYRSAVGGHETKTLVVYDEPFWRQAGFSGQSAEPGSVAEVTLDASPSSGTPGVIASFTFGPVAELADALDERERRQAVLRCLAARFGPKALSPDDYVETAWWTEPWTRGCSFAHLPPGLLTRHGHLLREPFQRVHWAGTETATISHGAVDGAVRSGQRAAAEVLERITTDASSAA